MTYSIIRTQPRDIPSLGIKKGDDAVVHKGDRASCEKMLKSFSSGRPDQFRIA